MDTSHNPNRIVGLGLIYPHLHSFTPSPLINPPHTPLIIQLMISLLLLVFISVYLTYHITLFPSVSGGDSGELLAESCHLGTVHPPGYPLFTLISHLVGKMNFPRIFLTDTLQIHIDTETTVAWRVNHLCCIFGAIAATLVSYTCYRLLSRYKVVAFAPSCIAGMLFAFSPLVWEHAIGAEVFALNNMLCAAIVALTVVVFQYASDSDVNARSSSGLTRIHCYVVLGAFLCGVSLANQHASTLLLIVVVPAVLLRTTKYHMSLLYLGLIASAFAVGFGSYVYLFFSSLRPKPGSWGDTSNIYGLLRHMLRAEYGTFKLGMTVGSESALERIGLYIIHTFNEGYYVGLPLALIGLMYVWQLSLRRMEMTEQKIILTKFGQSGKKLTSSKMPSEQCKGSTGGDSGTRGKKNRIKQGKDQENVSQPSVPVPVSGPAWEVMCLAISWVTYVVLWHCVLSNIPLSSPMPYGVHARFWMQPNIFVCIFTGTGVSAVMTFVSYMLSSTYTPSKTVSIKELNKTKTIDVPDEKKAEKVSLVNSKPVENKNENSEQRPQCEDSSSQSEAESSISSILGSGLELLCVGLGWMALLHDRFDIMDKSSHGWIMHKYGEYILNSTAAPGSLLLSHTDLNWNTVRYLQVCEGLNYSPDGVDSIGSHTTHLNFQLMPYPWFQKQQGPLYKDVVFPAMFKGVTTARTSKENALLVHRLIDANFVKTNRSPYNGDERPIFLDMQAVNDIDIGAGGVWGNYTLVPWGLVYMVRRKGDTNDLINLHQKGLQQLKYLQEAFPMFNRHREPGSDADGAVWRRKLSTPGKELPFMELFPPGTWEHAVVSTYHDAHNQLGLNILSLAIEMQKSVKSYGDLCLVIDRLDIAAMLLSDTIDSIEFISQEVGLYKSPYLHIPLSSPLRDLFKNAALAYMRLEGVLTVGMEHREKLVTELSGDSVSKLVSETFEDRILSSSHLEFVRRQSVFSISRFLAETPHDRDAATFQKFLSAVKGKLAA